MSQLQHLELQSGLASGASDHVGLHVRRHFGIGPVADDLGKTRSLDRRDILDRDLRRNGIAGRNLANFHAEALGRVFASVQFSSIGWGQTVFDVRQGPMRHDGVVFVISFRGEGRAMRKNPPEGRGLDRGSQSPSPYQECWQHAGGCR